MSWRSIRVSSWPCTGTGKSTRGCWRGAGIRAGAAATKPAKGADGRPGLVDGKFAASAPNQPHVSDITYARMAGGGFGCTAFVTDVYARHIVGRACATTMDTREPPLRALGTGDLVGRVAWRRRRAGSSLRSWVRYISMVYATRVNEYGMPPSTGTVGDSYDNAMAESVNGAYKTELVRRRGPFADLAELEPATFRWVSWWNSKRLHRSLGYRTPEQVETEYYANQAAQAASL